MKRIYRTSILVVLIALPLFVIPASTQNPAPTGVLRLRVRVKIGETSKGLARKRFYLIKGTLEQNRAILDAAKDKSVITRDCFYSKLGASPALIDWLKAGDCESIYCREVEPESLKTVPEFATAYVAAEKEYGNAEIGRKWLSNNIQPELRDGFYRQRQNVLQDLLKQAEAQSGAPVLSVMTDRNGTAYFTDLTPGNYVLTNLLPDEVGPAMASWNCDVQIKPGDIATEKPYQVSNRKDKNVKCVAVEEPLPACK
ncbi:MAG TPA: hypothetical protein VI306_11160 [Pyrinomonadaceae bacterium]